MVKLFGYSRSWRESHAGERAAYALLATDPGIAAPRLLAEGQLYYDVDAAWPYLVTTRMSGVSWRNTELSVEQKLSVAADLVANAARARVASGGRCNACGLVGGQRNGSRPA